MCGVVSGMAEKEIVSVPYSLISGRYLGTTSRILLAGSLPNQTSRLDLVNLSNPDNNYQSANLISSCSLKGICTAVDVFGHSSLGKSFTAVATQQNGSGQLSIYEIPSTNDSSHHSSGGAGGDLKFREIRQQFQTEDSIYTSITSHSNNNQLTACTEFGDVIIHDYSGYEITRFNADYCGLNAIKYSNSGDLITLGMSSGGQLSIWDTRSSSAALVRCLRPPPISSTTISYLTSVLTSHRNDYDLICGTSTGSIIQWDTRSDGVIFSPHQVHSPSTSGSVPSSISLPSISLCSNFTRPTPF
jgi:WD40 repeat protein